MRRLDSLDLVLTYPASISSKTPIKTLMDKIILWIKKEGKRVVSFASDSSNIINEEVGC